MGTSGIDLTNAVVVAPELAGPAAKALDMFVQEIERRTWVRWERVAGAPEDCAVRVCAGLAKHIEGVAGARAGELRQKLGSSPEGFTIATEQADSRTSVYVIGNDDRGLLFGLGRLLREMGFSREHVWLGSALNLSAAPHYPIRGHQIGYRPKVNTYDGWTPEHYEQYIRELAIFGTNLIQLIPPRSDDDDDSPLFPLPMLEMIQRVAKIVSSYALDFWLWYPIPEADYDTRGAIDAALEEWGVVFKAIDQLDGIVVPAGDPGDFPPDVLMRLVERQASNLRSIHPGAQVWIAPQSFNMDRMDAFISILVNETPGWLDGIAYGPQVRISLEELRARTPERYPIIRYDDITHTMRCQYAMPKWDPAYALTENREIINPRPTGFAHILRLWSDCAVGFIGYSEGCHDDVNKVVWSDLGWDLETPVIDTLRQYARFFIHSPWDDAYAQALLALEDNWRGPLALNAHVFTTLRQFQDMEAAATPATKLSWRFQQGLYRAYYDAYVARRLAYETETERQALSVLERAREGESSIALDEAERILERAVLEPVAQELRARVFELAEGLFQSIRMQLSVPKYFAIAWDRGANLDLIDRPLNNRLWLARRFEEIRALESDRERLAAIYEIVNWTNPGPGGFYDDLGNPGRQPHLVMPDDPEMDPEHRRTPLLETPIFNPLWRMSWMSQAEARYDSELRLRYKDLDPRAGYRVRAVYAGIRPKVQIRLDANDGVEIHPFIDKPEPVRPVEFDVPIEATCGGTLELRWRQAPGSRETGRGCDVSEVWLIRTPEPQA